MNLRADLTKAGMVRLTDASNITNTIGKALAATEKNPALEGTLANQIEKQQEVSEISISRSASDNIQADYSTGHSQGKMVVLNLDIYLRDIKPYTTYILLTVDQKKPIGVCRQTINVSGSAFDIGMDTNGTLTMGSAAASGDFSFRSIFTYFTN